MGVLDYLPRPCVGVSESVGFLLEVILAGHCPRVDGLQSPVCHKHHSSDGSTCLHSSEAYKAASCEDSQSSCLRLLTRGHSETREQGDVRAVRL